MVRRVLNNPLTEEQTQLAAKINLFFLVRDTVIRHEVDGGIDLPAGRYVMIIPRRKNPEEDEYLCQEMIVAAPGVTDPQSKLKGAKRLYSRKGFRILVVPVGKELEYFRTVATSSGLIHPAIGNHLQKGNGVPKFTQRGRRSRRRLH